MLTIGSLICLKLISDFLRANYFDLENPSDIERLANPKLAFEHLKGTIIIDEIQRKPNLFLVLRYIHDESTNKQFFSWGVHQEN